MSDYGNGGWSLVDIVKYLAKKFEKIEQELEEIKKMIGNADDNTNNTGN